MNKNRSVTGSITLLLFLILSFYSCASVKKVTSTKTFQVICGCPVEKEIVIAEKKEIPKPKPIKKDPPEETPSKREEALGSLPIGSLDKMGEPDYLEKVYEGIRKDFEYTGTVFDHQPDGISTKGISLKKIKDENKKMREILITIDGDVSFPSGKTTLTPKAKELIDKIGDALVAYPETTVRVGGHTDTPGSFQLNLKLSKGRANSVKVELLETHKIPEMRFREVDGYADMQKVVDTKGSEPKNRRTEVYVGTVRRVIQ